MMKRKILENYIMAVFLKILKENFEDFLFHPLDSPLFFLHFCSAICL